MSTEGPTESKKQKLDPLTDGGDVGESEIGNDMETQKALEAIDSIQNEIDGLNEKASEEILEVEKKYKKLRQPHFDKRNEIIEHIPNFWVTSLLNHPQIATVVNQKEKECLQYLNQVEVEEFEDIKSGYKLSFTFKTNPYFTNEVLCKEFHLDQTGDPESKSTEINWKDGMDLTKLPKTVTAAVNRRRGLQRSFFTWFLDNDNPILDSIAEVIKDDMWPNPLQYYLVSERDIDENGMGDSDDEDGLDESVVVVEDDDDEDEDEEIYEVEDEDDDELDTTGDVEVIEEEDVVAEDLEEEEECVEEVDKSKDEDDAGGKDKDEDEDSMSKSVDENQEDETKAV